MRRRNRDRVDVPKETNRLGRPMTSSLGRRIFLAHLELSYRLGRRVTLAEFGELVAKEMDREAAFTAAAVSRWESGNQIPSPAVIEAISSPTRIDPGRA